MLEILKQCFTKKMLIQFFMGIYSGLPLLLVGSTLQAWMREQGINLKTIGIFALVGMPYTLKFLWSPFIDRFKLPILDRRRGWMALTQVVLAGLLFVMSLLNPIEQTMLLATVAFLISFSSATQDIVIDAYRREALTDEELGLGSSLYVNGYRVAIILSGALALAMAESMPWSRVYQVMALMMGSGVIFTFLASSTEDQAAEHAPKSMKEAVIGPFMEYLKRKDAITMLLFILFYKVGDSMAAHMSMPLYIDLGYSKSEIAKIAKGIGMVATITGGTLGGVMMIRLGVNKALWIFGSLQMVSTAGFSVLASMSKSLVGLSTVIGIENLCSGMGTTAFVAFMASITNKKFTATQYALLTSLMGVPRVIASAPTGWMVQNMGYPMFFIFCTLIAVPGLFLLGRFAPFNEKKEQTKLEAKEA